MPEDQAIATFKPCAIVPVYNHERALAHTLAEISANGLPIVLIDDGSAPEGRALVEQLAAHSDAISLLTRPVNGGKGAAVKDGVARALQLGYTHGLQIDADGQHNCDDIPRFLAAAARQPDALIAGVPRFDQSIPAARFYSRYLTHVWVWINSLSLEIRDSMCGFRVYPLAASARLISRQPLGDRMDFDPAFIVRWRWQGLPLVQLDTAVTYPADGVSHFLPWRDNLLISAMHARLFFGMLRRLPAIVLNRASRIARHALPNRTGRPCR